MNAVSENQTRRAENIIWNCAGSYDFAPDFKAFDRDGNADLYFNCILGAARYHYDYACFDRLFVAFEQEEDADTYVGLFWLGLENAVYPRERVRRPVLEQLRTQYARNFIRAFESSGAIRPEDDYRLLDALSLAHWHRVLGEEPRISAYDITLLDELEFSPELSSEEIAARAELLFQHWFQIRARERRQQRHFHLPGLQKRNRTARAGRLRPFGGGFLERSGRYGGSAVTGGGEESQLATKMSASELRAFMETKFGKSLYSPRQQAEAERSLCTGSHSGCHLLFTAGEACDTSKIQNAFEALSRQQEEAQVQRNRRYYRDHLARNRTAISQLSGKIRNSVLLHLQPTPVKSNAGTLNGRLVWRAAVLEDAHVFRRRENDDAGDLCVDLLLDASTSQKNRQEIISTQAYIIAEALTRCGIPVRVLSFCSMTGYTILRVFRDYRAPRDDRRIFEYVSNGCNRDGLAIRAAHHLIGKEAYEHKLLIVLSDVKPNDVVKIHTASAGEGADYEKQAGLRDTALEVRSARADGIAVLCIFTGEDEDLSAARMVYGRDFVRIRGMDQLADTVGLLIQNHIKNF